jgi:RHS repeat-associated protein
MLATINDKKLATDDGNGEVAWYEADVVSANDYYPFGMIMPGRKYAASELYRYGFNGKENDNEVKGEGGQQDYGMRIYDPRLGRFLSVDPLMNSFSMFSPFQYASNTPIAAIDLDGLESKVVIDAKRETSTDPKSSSTDAAKVFRQASMQMLIVNWLVPQLHIKGASAGENDYLTTEERNTLIRETVGGYLTFNSSEKVTNTFTGESVLSETMLADLNYELVFGSKTSSKIIEVKDAFDMTAGLYGYYSDATGKGKFINNTLKLVGYANDIMEGDFLSLTGDVVSEVAGKMVDKTVESSIARGLLPQTAEFIAPRVLGVITGLLSPLEAGKGSSTAERISASRKNEGDQLHKNIIAALMFYFINGNKFNEYTIKEIVPSDLNFRQDNVGTKNGAGF